MDTQCRTELLAELINRIGMFAVENQSNIVNVEILLLAIGGNGVREELEIQIRNEIPNSSM